MRLIGHGLGWALVAVVCLGVAGAEFYLQRDFASRAVLTEAVITEREATRIPGSQLVWQRWRYAVDVSYPTPQGRTMSVQKRVSRGDYLGLSDHLTVWVDPEAPSEIQLHGDDYATTGALCRDGGFGCGSLVGAGPGTGCRPAQSAGAGAGLSPKQGFRIRAAAAGRG